MVQRLSLYGVIAQNEFEMASKTIEMYTGMPPQTTNETREIWEPFRKYDIDSVRGQATQIEQYRLFIIRSGANVQLETTELPEAGKNISIISQALITTKLLGGDIELFMQDIGYKFHSRHQIRGVKYVLRGGLCINLFRIYTEEELIDKSDQWIVCCYVDVDHVTDLAAVDRGTQTLITAQHDLRNVVVLKPPQRNSFNNKMPRR